MNIKICTIVVDNEFIDKFKDKNSKCINFTDILPNNITEPTLIVGWSKAEALLGDNISIVNKNIKPNLYWTFSPKERLLLFNEDVEVFISKSLEEMQKGYEYQFIDPIIDDIKTIDNIKRYSDNKEIDAVYQNDEFIYFLNESNKHVFGMDIKYTETMGLNMDVLLDYFKNNSKKYIKEEYDVENSYYLKVKDYFKLEIPKKYLPYIINLDETDYL